MVKNKSAQSISEVPAKRHRDLVTRKQYCETRAFVCVMAGWAVICGIGFTMLMANIVHADAQERADVAIKSVSYDPLKSDEFNAVIPCVFVGLPLGVLCCCGLLAGSLSFSDLRHMQPAAAANSQDLPLQETLVRGSAAPLCGRTELLRTAFRANEANNEELVRVVRTE